MREMRHCYDSIVLAYGAAQDKMMGIPGEVRINVDVVNGVCVCVWPIGIEDAAGAAVAIDYCFALL